MTYDLTTITYANDTSDLIIGANTATGGLFLGGIYLALFVIIFLSLMRRTSPAEAAFAAATPGIVISTALFGMGWSSYHLTIPHIAIMIIAGIAMYKN